MLTCSMCGHERRDARDRARGRRGGRAKVPKIICDGCIPKTLASVRAKAADEAARKMLTKAHERYDGNVSQIARALGAERAHVRSYLRRYKIV